MLFIAFLSCDAMAQTCTGSFGDPVVSESFDNPGPLPDGQARNLIYVTNRCPENGQYKIVNTFPNECHTDTWHNVFTDHTGNGGYMMVINASEVKSQFFEKRVSGLCGNTVYRFSIYVLDLMRKENTDPAVIHPALRFVIEDGSGNILTEETKNIEPTYTAEFQPYGIDFATTLNTSEIVLKIFNDAAGGYGNDLIIDDIAFRACGPQVNNTLDGKDEDFTPECASSGTRIFTFQTTAQAGYEYQWQKLVNGDWQDIAGADQTEYPASIDLSVGAIHQYRVAAAKPGNIGSENCRVYSLPRSITIYAKPVLAPINNVTVCRGEDATINLSGGAKYRIDGPDGSQVEISGSQYTFQPPDSPGSWTYTAYAISAEGCYSEQQTFHVIVKAPFLATATASNTEICAGETVNLLATTDIADTYTYSWSPATGLSQTDVANPVATPTQTTTYSVIVSNGACAYSAAPVTIRVLEPASVKIAERKEIFEGQSVTLDPVVAGAVTDYSWSPATGLSHTDIANPVASPTDDITYTIKVTGPCNIAQASVFVRVYKKIVIPNTFTPNGDGINDAWNIEALFTYPDSETEIYNRNGQRVFRSIGYDRPWNGMYNGSVLPAGTYYYIINLKNNTPRLTGYVTILK